MSDRKYLKTIKMSKRPNIKINGVEADIKELRHCQAKRGNTKLLKEMSGMVDELIKERLEKDKSKT